jgi:hypothetical protein
MLFTAILLVMTIAITLALQALQATGDAPHNPFAVVGLSPINTPLHYILSGGENFFRFNTPNSSTIQVHLDNLPANYDLYVYNVSNGGNVGLNGQSTNSGTTSELVTINNAPASDYMVRVLSVNGAFNPNKPYQLEFDVVPAP